MKICPECGRVLSFNSYFGTYICDRCGWEHNSEPPNFSSIMRYTSVGFSAKEFRTVCRIEKKVGTKCK